MSENERLEYAELNQSQRQDDTIIYNLASVLLPLSFGSFAVVAQLPKLRYALAAFSVALYAYWLLVAIRLSWYSAVRFYRMEELEKSAGLRHHTLIRDPPANLARKLGNHVSIRFVRFVFLIALISAWVLLLVLMRGS